MIKPGSLIVAHMMEPQEVGSYFDRSRWPLHLTLLPWFTASQAQHGVLRQQLAGLAQTTPPAIAIVGDEHLFGPEKNVPVHVIANKAVLQPLHDALLNIVGQLELPLVNSDWVGADYSPHITQQPGDRHANAGDSVKISDFYLVQLVDGPLCQILAHFALRGDHA